MKVNAPPDTFNRFPDRIFRYHQTTRRFHAAHRQGDCDERPTDHDKRHHIGYTVHQVAIDRILFRFVLSCHIFS